MFYEKSISRHWLIGLLISLSWGHGIVPAFALDPSPLSATASTLNASGSAPLNLASNTPGLSLRDDPSSSTTASSSSGSASSGTTASASTSSPSQNVTVNLINLMVKRNLISKEEAENLITQAQQEADVAKAQANATQAAAQRALTAQQSAPAPTPTPAPASDDTVQVNYVPDVVKNQIRDEVTQSVMKETREENLVSKSDTPDWVKRFRVTGDIRVRYEDDMFPSGNAVGNFTNFNAINTSSSGFNQNTLAPGFTPPSQYDVDQDRNRFRLRARIGAEVELDQGFSAGLRIATGSDNQPVTENQTLGGVNSFTQGQGGDFSKYSIWLDRAFIRYETGSDPDKLFSATVGRFENPFMHTSMIWADDIGFDGVVLQGKYKVADGVTPFLTAGAFPVFNTDFNFSSNQATKFSSEDKYLIAAQAGTTWQVDKDFSVKVAAAYYDFEDIEGKVSSPITSAIPAAVGNTDDSRPTFAQNGNTYIALRDFEDPTLNLPGGNTTENQYYGLATPFHDLALTGQLDFSHFDPFHINLMAEYVNNLAFDRNAIINNGPASNPGPQNNTTSLDPNSFVGGNMGWMTRLKIGKVSLEELWDWNVDISYRYVQSDATVDAFTDADFGAPLYGTNLKGYTVGGNLALSRYIWTGLHWMSADAVAGPTFKSDLIQFDINAKF